MSFISQGIIRLSRLLQIRSKSTVTVADRRRVRSKLDMELKSRENPVVTKLDSPEFKNLFTKEVMDLKKLFDRYQYEIRVAGGAVRDLLMGQQPKDLDFATTATPQQMKEMFTAENIRMINMAGEKHGTITPRINDKENFEVTTLRIDMITDGRHAEVEFTTDWKLDANRRDLTINSMFLEPFMGESDAHMADFISIDGMESFYFKALYVIYNYKHYQQSNGFDGSVYDYFFGYEDLQKRRVAFVGDADVRIKEDYLRIMRYFRFYGRIAETPDHHDEETLNVISRNVEGLKNVSGERIWMELKKTLQGKFAGELLKDMLKTGVGTYIGLPMNPDLEELDRVLKRAHHLCLHPMSYLTALLRDMDEATVLHSRLKFSAFDRDLAYFLIEHREEKVGARPLMPYEKLVLNAKIKQKDAMEYVREVLKYKGDEILLEQFNKWEVPRFPIGGKELKENGVPPGKMYGRIIEKLKTIWIDSEYKQTSGDLVRHIPNILEEFDKMKLKQSK